GRSHAFNRPAIADPDAPRKRSKPSNKAEAQAGPPTRPEGKDRTLELCYSASIDLLAWTALGLIEWRSPDDERSSPGFSARRHGRSRRARSRTAACGASACSCRLKKTIA